MGIVEGDLQGTSMPNPVSRNQKPPPVITFNDALSQGAVRTFFESVPTPIAQPPVERVRNRSHERKEIAKEVAKEVILHGGAHLLKHSSTVAFSTMGGVAGLALTFKLLADVSVGSPELSERDVKQVQDQFRQATVLMAKDGLPKAYVQGRITSDSSAQARLIDMLESLRVRTGSEDKAEEMMMKFQQEAKRSASQGMDYVVRRNVRTQGELNQLLAKDVSFRDRYSKDLAFYEGVNAAIWLNLHEPGEYGARYARLMRPTSAPVCIEGSKGN